jgi:hypothetical protein
MIKAYEVRVGNWVQCVGVYKNSVLRAGAVQVDAELIWLIDSKKILCIVIPLTPQILKKAGFDGKWLRAGGSELDYKDDELGITGPDSCTSGQTFYAPCKHLHQLQNLYFALTGEELSITL